MANFLRFSLFPLNTNITNSDGERIFDHQKNRVIITDDEVFVYIDGQNGKVETAFNDRLLDFSGDVRTGWTATTEDGFTVNITRSASCSCGSRLKGFNPFPAVPMEARA